MRVYLFIDQTNWGADRQTLLKQFKTFVRTRTMEASFNHSGKKIQFKILNPSFHGDLRLALESFKTSSIRKFVCWSKLKYSTNLIYNKLALRYHRKLKANPTNPKYHSTFQPNSWNVSLKKAINRFGLQMEPIKKILVSKIHNIFFSKNTTLEHNSPPNWFKSLQIH